jgi:putative SOS response-associated peptidase YedK
MLEDVCGRYVSTTPSDVLAAQFGVDEIVGADLDRPRWNVAPTDPVPAISETAEGVRRLGSLRWGLLPSFVTDPSTASRRINARAETVATSPAFRASFEKRRCLVPADAFYEWHRAGKGPSQPYAIRHEDGTPLAFAGIWSVWREPGAPEDAEPLRTFSIVTTTANDVLAPIHDRMPVIIAPDAWSLWLGAEPAGEGEIRGLLRPAPAEGLIRYPVARSVGDVRNDGPILVEPIVLPEDPAPSA